MRNYNNPTRDKLKCPDSAIWNILSVAAISLCLAIFLIQWRQLPFFLDMYYHLAVARGFEAAGGIAARNFWEYGPKGAPHLYPPLIHLILLFMLKSGIGSITALRLLSSMLPAGLLATLWYLIKNILSKRQAFFVVFSGLCASLFMISASFTPAATLASIFMLIGICLLHKGYTFPAALMFGIIYYTHTGVALISLFLTVLMKISKNISIKQFMVMFLLPLMIGAPWLLHIALNIPQISWHNTARMPIRIYPVITFFFVAGLYISSKEIKRHKIFFLLLLSLIPIAVTYPFRFFCSQGMIGILILSGIGLERAYSLTDAALGKREITKKYRAPFLITLLLYLLFFAPGINLNRGGHSIKVADSLPAAIFEGKDKTSGELLSTGIYSRDLFSRLADYVMTYSKKGEYIYSNYRYVAGMLWNMTKRPVLSHMLLEINNKNAKFDINNAAVLIIIDMPNGIFDRLNKGLKNNFKTVAVEKKEDAVIYILKNKQKGLPLLYDIQKPIVNINTAYAILAVYALSIIAGIILYAKSRSKP